MRTYLLPREHRLHRRGRVLLAAPLLLASVTGCSNGDDEVVTVFGPEIDPERASLQETLDELTEGTGIRVQVEGTRDFEALIGGRIAAGNPPDIAMFPQPARLAELSDEIVPLPRSFQEDFDRTLTELVTFDGELKALPVKTDLKSLVWYSPAVFASKGYDDALPLTTFEEFLALVAQMQEDEEAGVPFCVGIESGEASGWPMTDWIEDWMLRRKGVDFYDRWVSHEIPFDHPEVIEVAEEVKDLWTDDDVTYGGADAAAVTFFEDAGLPLLEGECMMHRQANFAAAYWPRGTVLGRCLDDEGVMRGDCTQSVDGTTRDDLVAGPVVGSCSDGNETVIVGPEPAGPEDQRDYDDGGDPPECKAVDAFVLPRSTHEPVVLSGGLYAAAFTDDEEVMEVMQLISQKEFAEVRAQNPIGGFLSPNTELDPERYPDELTRTFGEILSGNEFEVRYDASDLMPPAVANAFNAACVDIITPAADKSVAEAFSDVETIWNQLEEQPNG